MHDARLNNMTWKELVHEVIDNPATAREKYLAEALRNAAEEADRLEEEVADLITQCENLQEELYQALNGED